MDDRSPAALSAPSARAGECTSVDGWSGTGGACEDGPVLGAVIIVVVLVVVIPVGVLISGAAMAALLGHLAKRDADARGEEVWRELNY